MSRRNKRNTFKIVCILFFLIILLGMLALVLILGTQGSGTLPPVDAGALQQTQPEPDAQGERLPQRIAQILDTLFPKKVRQTQQTTYGIDVAKYQGTIDFQQVAQSGVDFVMVRIGYRTMEDGTILADTNAAYNLQQAQKYGIKLGAYFFSTAVSPQEAQEEADWIARFLAPYPITYPVAYNCEGFDTPGNRQYGLSVKERTDIALCFLEAVERHGYEAMFYASKNEMTADASWEVSRIEPDYKIWVAQYPEAPDPVNGLSSYEGFHHMWQYTRDGAVAGIGQSVDQNVAYFGYDGIKKPKSDIAPEPAEPDVEALMDFQAVEESVTAKDLVNLRSTPSQAEDSQVLYTLTNGEVALRTGISTAGWSRVTYRGQICYAVSSYLTTDSTPEQTEPQSGFETAFRIVSEDVTAKDLVNLRSIPSVEREDSQVLRQLKNGEIARRIGISDNGWSKLELDGSIYYAVSSYLKAVEDTPTDDQPEPFRTTFREVSETVTAKEYVNLRSIPSVDSPDSQVVTQLKNGETAIRTGINEDLGWSRLEYNGQTLYCVSSYLKLVQ